VLPSLSQAPPVIGKRRPQAAALRRECRDALGRAAIGVAFQKPGGEVRAPVRIADREHVGPVHAGDIELPRANIITQRRLANAVQILAGTLVDFGVAEPISGLAIHLGGRRLEE